MLYFLQPPEDTNSFIADILTRPVVQEPRPVCLFLRSFCSCRISRRPWWRPVLPNIEESRPCEFARSHGQKPLVFKSRRRFPGQRHWTSIISVQVHTLCLIGIRLVSIFCSLSVCLSPVSSARCSSSHGDRSITSLDDISPVHLRLPRLHLSVVRTACTRRNSALLFARSLSESPFCCTRPWKICRRCKLLSSNCRLVFT